MATFSILTEAGSRSGLGHVSRCMALASELSDQVSVYIHPDDVSEGIEIENGEALCWRDLSGRSLQIFSQSIVIIDSYLATEDIYISLRKIAKALIAIDDFDRIQYPCDMVINPSVRGPIYSGVVESLSGAEYVIIHPDLFDLKKKIEHNPTINKITITFGGSIRTKLYEQVIRLTEGFGSELVVIAGSDSNAKVLEHLETHCVKIYGRVSQPAFGRLVCESDLVITAGGQTLNELAYLGVPVLAIEVAVDEYFNVAAHVEIGSTLCHLNVDRNDFSTELLACLQRMSSVETRLRCSAAGTQLIDGFGAKRVATVLTERFAE